MNKLFILFFIVLVSCSKRDAQISDSITNEHPTNKVFEKFKLVGSINEQKVVYSTLTDFEKAQMWRFHIDEMMVLNKFSAIQRSFLEETKNLLNESNFAKKSFMDSKEMVVWNYRANELFSRNEQYLLFVSFNSKEIIINNAPRECSCSTVDDWCSRFNGGLYIYNCEGSANCSSTTSGCGTFWSYGCNDNCKATSIMPS